MGYFRRGKIEELPSLQKDYMRLLQKNNLYLLIVEISGKTWVSRGDMFWNLGYSFEGKDHYEEENLYIEEEFEGINSFIGFFRAGYFEKIVADSDYYSGGPYGEERNIHKNNVKYFFTMETCPFIFNEVPLYFFPFDLSCKSYCKSIHHLFLKTYGCKDSFLVDPEVNMQVEVDNSGEKELLDMIDELLKENISYWQHLDCYYYHPAGSGLTSHTCISSYFEKSLFRVRFYDIGETDQSYIYCLCDREMKSVLYAFTISCPSKFTSYFENPYCSESYCKYMLSFSDDGELEKWVERGEAQANIMDF